MSVTAEDIAQALALDSDDVAMDDGALGLARAQSGDSQARLQTYFKAHNRTPGLTRAILQTQRWLGRTIALCIGVACVSGVFAAASAFSGNGSGQVNIFWLLAALLGVHAFSLILWALVALQGPGLGASFSISGAATWLFRVLSNKFETGGDEDQILASRFVLERWTSGRSGLWSLSAFSHGFWFAYLSAGLIASIVILSVERYDFVWATTLLDTGAFTALTNTLGAPLSLFGVSVPSQSAIAAAQMGSDLSARGETDNRSWGVFVLAALAIYGVLVRAALYAFSKVMLRRAVGAREIDIAEPFVARILARIHESHSQSVVVDPDLEGRPPTKRPVPKVTNTKPQNNSAPQAKPKDSGPLIGWEMDPLDAEALGGRAVLGWFDRPEAFASALAAYEGRRLTVCVSLLTTPDRGVKAAIAPAAGLASETVDVLLCDEARLAARMTPKDAERRMGDWWSVLLSLGFSADSISTLSGTLETADVD